eukprot:scaffold75311_cov47-Phaeocystis_antarctica.AAC.1
MRTEEASQVPPVGELAEQGCGGRWALCTGEECKGSTRDRYAVPAWHHKPAIINLSCFPAVTRVPNKGGVVAKAPLVLLRTGVVQRVVQFKVRAQHVAGDDPVPGEVVIWVHLVRHGRGADIHRMLHILKRVANHRADSELCVELIFPNIRDQFSLVADRDSRFPIRDWRRRGRAWRRRRRA